MKKYFFLLVLFIISISAFAQDNGNRAKKVGSAIGEIFGYMLIPAILIGGIAYSIRRQKK
jgi:hypothetical protein